MSTSIPPPPALPSSVPVPGLPSKRSTAALITALAALLSAIAAFTKAPQEPEAKVSYVVLQKAVEDLSREDEDLRKDLTSMRTAFEDYVKAKEGTANVVTQPDLDAGALPAVELKVQPSIRHTAPTTSASSVAARVLEPPKAVTIPSARAAASPPRALPPYATIQQKAKQ